MAKVDITSWDVAEKLGLCYEGTEETVDKWHGLVEYQVFDFHGKKIRIRDNGYVYSSEDDYHEKAAEIALFRMAKAVSELMTDWVE